jgi:hypothetical protein
MVNFRRTGLIASSPHLSRKPVRESGFKLSLPKAIAEFTACLDRTLDKLGRSELTLFDCDPAVYRAKARKVKLSKLQRQFLRDPVQLFGVLSLHEYPGKDKTLIRSFTAIDKQVLEALFVMCRLELDKGRQVVKFPQHQLISILQARHPKNPPTFTLQDLSSVYLPRFVTRRPDKRGKGDKAGKLELLIRVKTGYTGRPSDYELTPPMLELLGQTPGQARGGTSCRTGATLSTSAGFSAVSTAEKLPREPDPLEELPEDDGPASVLAPPESDNPLMQLPED